MHTGEARVQAGKDVIFDVLENQFLRIDLCATVWWLLRQDIVETSDVHGRMVSVLKQVS